MPAPAAPPLSCEFRNTATLRSTIPRKPTISVAQAAERLGIPSRTIYEWCRLGKFPHIRLGTRRILILQSTVDMLLAPGTPAPGVIARVAAGGGDPW